MKNLVNELLTGTDPVWLMGTVIATFLVVYLLIIFFVKVYNSRKEKRLKVRHLKLSWNFIGQSLKVIAYDKKYDLFLIGQSLSKQNPFGEIKNYFSVDHIENRILLYENNVVKVVDTGDGGIKLIQGDIV